MNKVILMGRLTKAPDIRQSQGQTPLVIARYTLAIDRRRTADGQQATDFIPCVALGKNGEFAEKYLTKGTKIMVEGRIQTGSYTNKDGQKVYTVEVMVESHEFVESKRGADGSSPVPVPETDSQGFMNIPEGIDEELPFS